MSGIRVHAELSIPSHSIPAHGPQPPACLVWCDGRRKVQTRKLADHMAFLTNHVFFVPDLYRDDPWVEDGEETVEQWRTRVCVEPGVIEGALCGVHGGVGMTDPSPLMNGQS